MKKSGLDWSWCMANFKQIRPIVKQLLRKKIKKTFKIVKKSADFMNFYQKHLDFLVICCVTQMSKFISYQHAKFHEKSLKNREKKTKILNTKKTCF